MNVLRKKLLIVCTNADLAGAPCHVRDLAFLMRQQGWEVNVAFGQLGPIKKQLEQTGIPTHLIASMRSKISLSQDIKSYIAFKKLVKSFQPDLIHAHSSKAGMIGRLVGRTCKIPVVYTIHGWGFGPGRKLMVAFFVYLVELLTARFTNEFIAVSETDRNLGMKYLPIFKSQITTIYNSTKFVSKKCLANTIEANVIMVARDDYPKDYLTFFKALSKTKVDNVFVVGRGTDKIDFIEKARTLSKKNFGKIKFMGERSDIEALMEKSSIFVLSSCFEGLPISIIEAMSKGLPVIATAVGGIPELVRHGENGLLFDVGDSVILSKHLNTLSLNTKLRQRYGKASLKRFEADFNKEAFISRTAKVYFRALHN